jgi:hypothetical protein
MVYKPPGGWIEDYCDDAGDHSRFHARTDCPRIRQPERLRQVDRPYSAIRCVGCADEFGNNLERFSMPPPRAPQGVHQS